jgi:hypothetical protein
MQPAAALLRPIGEFTSGPDGNQVEWWLPCSKWGRRFRLPTPAGAKSWQAEASGYPFDSGCHYRLRPVNTLRNVVCAAICGYVVGGVATACCISR